MHEGKMLFKVCGKITKFIVIKLKYKVDKTKYGHGRVSKKFFLLYFRELR